MRKTLFLAFLIVPSVSWGQWNSFAWKKEAYKVEIVEDSIEETTVFENTLAEGDIHFVEKTIKGTTEQSTDTKPTTIRESEPTTIPPRLTDNRCEKLIRRYHSVCLPLNSLRISSPFGIRTDPFDNTKKAMHAGLDLKAYYEPVYTMFPGQVKKVGFDNRSGNFVTVVSGDYAISYCHMSVVDVVEGDYLRAGDTLGTSGNTGRSTGAHLHLTCRRSGKPIDPTIVLQYICNVRVCALEELERLASL